MIANADEILNASAIESSRIEYKSDWNPEKIMHTICAFANDIENIGGGYIIIGVEEENGMPKRPIRGIDKGSIDSINKELMGICNLFEPRYIPSTSHAIVDGKDIILIEAIVGESRPYKCPDSYTRDKSKRSGKSYYIRRLSSTIAADANDEHTLFNVSSNTPFDCRVNYDADLSDIRPSLVYEYLSKIGSERSEVSLSKPIDTLCKDLKISGSPPNDTHPINAGLLFFNEKPTRFIEYAFVDVVEMPDPTGEGMRESRFDGPLDIQLEKAMDHIKDKAVQVMINKDQDSPQASRTCSYPPAAIEEILTNAIYHRDYTIREPITVTIHPDRITVLSFPGPDRSISDDDIASFNMATTRYRNARIGDLLKHRGLAEKRGTGIATVLRALERNGSPMPIFETDEGRTFFRVTIMKHPKFIDPPEHTVNEPAVRRTREELRTAILEKLRDRGQMSMRDLAESLGYSRSAQNVYSAVRELVSEGRIEYTIPDKMSSRNQMIRIRI